MSDTSITPDDPDIPAEPPTGPTGPGPEGDDQPLGPPSALDPDEAPLPGVPESEPPASE